MSKSIEIRHLRYFLAVSQTENFTRAAERLNISQPSISEQITQLELALGTPLFRRVGKRVFLTEAGAEFRKSAKVVLSKLDAACTSVSEISGLLRGQVDVGVIPALHLAWIPAIFGRLAEQHPGLSVGVRELASSDVETELDAGRLDLGFGFMSHNSPNIRYEALVTQQFSLIVPKQAARFAGRATVSLKDLDGERLVLPPDSFDMRRCADAVLMQARVRPRISYEIDSIDSVLATVVHTGIPTLLPPIVLRGRNVPALRAIPLTGKVRRMDFGILWPAASTEHAAAVEVAEALKAALKAESGVHWPHGNGKAADDSRDRVTVMRRRRVADGTDNSTPGA